MCYTVGISSIQAFSAATSCTPDLTQVSFAAGDIIQITLAQDNGATDFSTSSSGWVLVGNRAQSGASRSGVAYKVAGASEANPVFSSGATSAVWIAAIDVIRDVDNTTPIAGWQRTDWAAASASSNTSVSDSSNSGAAISVAEDAFLTYACNTDGNDNYLRAKSDELTARAKYAGNGQGLVVGYRQSDAAGTVPAVTFYNSISSEGGSIWVVAYNNKTNGSRAPFCKTGVDEFAWYGSWLAHTPNPTWNGIDDITTPPLSTLNGITCSGTDATVNLSTGPLAVPWGRMTSFASTVNSASTWVGRSHAITSKDMTGKILALTIASAYSSASARLGSEGLIIGLSNDTDYVFYQLLPKSLLSASTAYGIQIALGNAAVYASSGDVAALLTAVTRIAFGFHRAGSSALEDLGLYIKDLCLLGGTTPSAQGTGYSVIQGGGPTAPADFRTLYSALESWGNYALATKQGDKQIVGKATVQIGDPAAYTYFDMIGGSFEFPIAKSNVFQPYWNVGALSVSVIVKASDDDTINLASGVLATSTNQTFLVHADSSLLADYSFNQSFIGWTVELKTGIPYDNVTYSSGVMVDAKGADFQNAIVKSSTGTDAAISFSANGGSMNLSTTDASRTSLTYHIELKSGVTDLELIDHTFLEDTSLDKVHVLSTSGLVSITIDGTTSLSLSDVVSEGASVEILAPQVYQKVTLTGLSTTCRVQLFDTDLSSELYNAEPGATSLIWEDPVAAVAERPIRLRITDYLGATAKIMVERNIGTCGILPTDYAISFNNEFEQDDSYNAQTAALGYNGADITDIEIDDTANRVKFNFLAGGDYDARRIYMYMVYWLDTEVGIRDDFVFCSPLDPVNLPMTGVLFENVTSPQETITFINAYVYDATTGRAKDLIVGDGINFAPDHVVQVVATVGGVNIITGDIADIPTAAEVAAEIVANKETLTVSSFLGLQQE